MFADAFEVSRLGFKNSSHPSLFLFFSLSFFFFSVRELFDERFEIEDPSRMHATPVCFVSDFPVSNHLKQ